MKLEILSLLLISIPALASAESARHAYQIDCVATTKWNDGHVSPLPEAKFSAVIHTREAKQGEFICNSAVDAPAERTKYVIESAETSVQVLKADKSGYFGVTTQSRSKFGSCDMRPYPGDPRNPERGQWVVSELPVKCDAAGACGRFGVIDPSSSENQVNAITWDVDYFLDQNGAPRFLQGEWLGGGIGVIYIPSSGHEEPFELVYLNKTCQLQEIPITGI